MLCVATMQYINQKAVEFSRTEATHIFVPITRSCCRGAVLGPQRPRSVMILLASPILACSFISSVAKQGSFRHISDRTFFSELLPPTPQVHLVSSWDKTGLIPPQCSQVLGTPVHINLQAFLGDFEDQGLETFPQQYLTSQVCPAN